ncbi:hypothetical protein [Ammoniphilus resinae]|uniref:Uncharacterized protein n=1 Tax=Ammoniphilus resinae TaxID=861532 RepID=A0ABS4GMU8_9BACL|nr:hypothetical protein [Ammoniphilus resinae]MBP1931598.1 hypothetical protein [Ammoniphilus resinae]
MLLQFMISITLLSFLFLWILDGSRKQLYDLEKELSEVNFLDRINKEKYLEEVGYNVLGDPW